MTLHLPDFPKQVVEAFNKGLDRGETVIKQKYFSQLKDLYEVLGISESDGVGFPSIYGAQIGRNGDSPSEDEQSEAPLEMKTEERPEQEEPRGSDRDGIQADDPAEELVGDENNVVEDNDDKGDNQDENNRTSSPTSDQHIPVSDDVVQLLGDDDDESDFEIASQAEEEDKAETALTDVDLADEGEGNMNGTSENYDHDADDFFNDLYSEPIGSDITVKKKCQIKLNKKSPMIDQIKLTKIPTVRIKKIKTCGNKRKFDVAINPPEIEKIEKKNPVKRSAKKTIKRPKLGETLVSRAQPVESLILEAKVPVNKVVTNTASPEKSKRRRKSSLASGPKINSEVTEYKCPVRDCRQVVKSDKKNHKIYKLLKHVIQKHLSETPCKLYDSSEIRYPKSKTRYKCHYCDKINDSSNSMFGHMALHHDDLFTRVHARLKEPRDQQKSKSILNNINGYLNLKWNRWAQCQFDNFKENLNKSKIICAPIPKISVVQGRESKGTLIKVDSIAKVQQVEDKASETAVTETSTPPAPPTIQRIEVEKRVGEESSNQKNEKEDKENNLHSIVENVETSKTESDDLDLSSVTIICKHCDYPYTDDEDLRSHLIGKHSSLFYNIKLLEAGEKFYECESNCQSFRTKKKLQFAKHLHRAHDIVSVELIADKESWNVNQLSYKDFCYVTNNDMLIDNPEVMSNMRAPSLAAENILDNILERVILPALPPPGVQTPSVTEIAMEQTPSDSDLRPCLHCPYLRCDERFPRKNELLNHYLSKHSTSSVICQFVEIIHPEISPVELTTLKIGQAMLTVFKCIFCPASFVREDLFIDHCSFHQNPRDLIQCEHCVAFIERAEIEAHSTPTQCPHFEERKRLLKLREVRL